MDSSKRNNLKDHGRNYSQKRSGSTGAHQFDAVQPPRAQPERPRMAEVDSEPQLHVEVFSQRAPGNGSWSYLDRP